MGREELKSSNEAMAKSLYQDDERGVQSLRSMRLRRNQDGGLMPQAYFNQDARYRKYTHEEAHEVQQRSDALHKETEARHEQHWNERFDIQNSHFDQSLFDQRIRTLSMSDKAKLAEGRLETAWTEMQSGSNPYQSVGIEGPATQSFQAQIDGIADTARSISMEGLKKQSAEVVIKQANAQRLKAEEALRNYVGGVGGADAAARVYASASSDVVKDYLDSVKAMGSIQEDYSVKELISVAHKGIRRDGSAATEAEIDSAIQQIINVKGNNWSFQKLKDHIADLGVNYDEETQTYTDINGQVVSREEASSRRTRQQIFVDAAKSSKLAIKSLSGTDRGDLENGTFTRKSGGKNGAIIRDIRDQKINANRLAGTDIDELMRTVQVLRDDEARGSLSSEARNALIAQIEFATDPANPQISGSIATREKNMMGAIAEYLRHGRDMSMEEKVRIENSIETPIPTHYEDAIDRFYDAPAKFTPDEPGKRREAYGPDGNTAFRGSNPNQP
jgi:hypothetical protein